MMRACAQPLLHEFSKQQFASPVFIALLTLPPQFFRSRPRSGLVNERADPISREVRKASERPKGNEFRVGRINFDSGPVSIELLLKHCD
jgi:hypothetical protein